MIADRMEDITDPESLRVNPKTDRNISLYGYIRGTSIKNHSNVHIAGKEYLFKKYFVDLEKCSSKYWFF